MTDPVNSSSPQPTTSTQSTHESSSVETNPPEAPQTDRAESGPGTEDVWETAVSNPFDQFGEHSPESYDASDVQGEEMSAWEMQAAANAADEGTFNIEDNRATGAIEQLYDRVVTDGERISTEFSIMRGGDSAPPQADLIELAGHPDELKETLLEIHNDPDTAQDVVDELQSQVVAIAGERIAAQARPGVEDTIRSVEQLDSSSESRRAFLASMATVGGDAATIAEGLEQFGLSSSAAEEMSGVLAGIAGDDEAMRAFIDGESGERTIMGREFSGGFDSLERQFSSELDSMKSGLESLNESLSRDQIQHDRFLTDPTIAPVREQVLEEMGAVTSPPDQVNGLGEVFNDATADSQRSQTTERVMVTVVNIAGAIGATAATGGGAALAIGGGLLTGGAQAVPDIAEAQTEAQRTQGAVAADFAPPELLERAEQDRDIAYAINAVGVVGGAFAPTTEAGAAAGVIQETTSMQHDLSE